MFSLKAMQIHHYFLLLCFGKNSDVPLKQVRFKLNLDMMKRGNSLGEADLQVGGQIFAWGEGVLPDHHVGYIVDGEAKL